ncbi:MAG TPA: tetratricopeptide repeat protein [Candidatus Sulfotelmatobacter sp.]|nr:tetratricopeptide repeat protein [Candidatus Sulfotelmatobacter sp.]
MKAGDAASIVRDSEAAGREGGVCSIWKSAGICFLLALAVWIIYGQTVRYDFINYDDDAIVYENPEVTRGLDLHEIGRVFTEDSGRDSWFPLTDVSHMLDWQFYGPNAGGHHLTNVLLHAATAILLFLGLQTITGAAWRSAFVAAIFAVHPLRVESVAWIAERKDVLSGFFFMLALLIWGRYAQDRRQRLLPNSDGLQVSVMDPRLWTAGYCWVLVFFVAGLLCKSMVVTLPVVLLVLDFWPLGRFKTWSLAELILEKWPLFVISAAGCAVTVLTQPHVVLAVHPFSLPWRVGNALLAYVDYLAHMVYPVGLELLYPHPPAHLPFARVCLSVLVLLAVSAGAVIGRRRYPYLMAGWLWYLVVFLPVIDIMQTGDQARADRYTYLPQIGLYIAIAWGMADLLRSAPYRRVLLGCTAAVLLAALSVAAHVQATYWKSSISIWTRTLSRWPQSYIAHCNLGIALADQGDVTGAVQHFNQALQINPDDAKSINNLGKVLTSQGKLDAAIQDFHQALQLEPDDVKILNNLSVALADEGKVNDAVQDLEHALQLKPEYAEAYYNLGNIYASRANYDDAALNYGQALDIDPDFAEARCNLGLTLAKQGKLDDAIEEYQQAIELKPHYLDALNDLGGAYAARGDTNEAVEYYQQAVQLKPDDPNTLNNLGVALAREGKLADAIQYLDRAVQLNPNDASCQNNLGITLANAGNMDEAIQHLQEALYLAQAQNQTALEESIRARLERYGAPTR